MFLLAVAHAAVTPSVAAGLVLVVAGIGMVFVGQRRAARKRLDRG